MSEKSRRESPWAGPAPTAGLRGVGWAWQGHGPLPCRQEDDLTGNFVTLLIETSVTHTVCEAL